MDRKLFEELKESLQQAVEHAAGKRHDLRTTTLPRPPQKNTENRPSIRKKTSQTTSR